MIRTAFSIGVSVLALTLTAPVLAQSQGSASEQTPAQAPPAMPTMSFGEWGVDPAALDDSIDPGDDFFAYVNKKWLDANPLPPEFSRFGAFNLLREKSTSDVKALIDDLVAKDATTLSADEKRIVDAYNAYLDVAGIDAAGMSVAQPYLDRIVAAGSLADLGMLWATPGYAGPLGGFVNVDAKQPDRYVTHIGVGGLGLPDRDYYLDESDKGREIQSKYRDYLAFLFGEAGYADPAAAAVAVYGFEDRIAREVSWARDVQRNRDLTYNALSAEELTAMAGELPFAAMIERLGWTKSPIFVVSAIPPSEERTKELGLTPEVLAKIGKGLPGMLELLNETPLATLQAWTIKSFLSGHADVLPSRFDDARFDFYSRTLQGVPEQRPRWKRAVDATEGALGELVGKSYVERYFPPENKAAMTQLVANLRLALGQSIDGLDWMGEETRKAAQEKLASFDPKIGYRDNLEIYEGLAITADNPLANEISAEAWGLADNSAKLGEPIDRTEWFMLPQTVNAYYNPTKNEIVFPAAILQQPFFGIGADIAVNYGAIGAVIGHEMGHGFDDQGSKSDAAGMLRNWWTDADRKAFEARANALVEQYNSFCPLDEGKTCVNGRLTLGENIGDVGGLSMAYRAYKLATEGQDVPVIDGLTGDQRFFLAWAQVWRSAQREDAYRQRLRTDPHSPEEYRANGAVRNFDPWYEAFGVTPDDDLYLPPEQRVRIW